MLSIHHMRTSPAQLPGHWARENSRLLIAMTLWAIAMLCLAWLGQPSDAAAEHWYYVSNVEGGLL